MGRMVIGSTPGNLAPLWAVRQLKNSSRQLWVAHGMTMYIAESLNLTSSGLGKVLLLGCSTGLVGTPFSACVRGEWRLSGGCATALTAGGCQCKRRWILCEGLLRQDCQMWYGCKARSSSGYGWCETQNASCSRALIGASTWDYCTDGPAEATWAHEPAPSRKYILLLLSLMIVVVLVLISWMLHRNRKSQRDPSTRELALVMPETQVT